MHESDEHASTTGADRVPERDRSAADVDPLVPLGGRERRTRTRLMLVACLKFLVELERVAVAVLLLLSLAAGIAAARQLEQPEVRVRSISRTQRSARHENDANVREEDTAHVCDKKPATHNVSADPDADNGARARGGNTSEWRPECATRGTRRDRAQATHRMPHKWARRRRPSALQQCSRSHWLAEAAKRGTASNGSALASDRAAPDRCFLVDQLAISSHFLALVSL